MINSKQAHKYCSEDISLIEGYEAAISDYTQVWVIHHRGEILPCGIFSPADLKKFNLYWHRPAAELVFLTRSGHISLHNKADQRGKASSKIMNAKKTFEQRSKVGKIGSKNQPHWAKVLGGKIGGAKGGKIGGKIGGRLVGKMPWWNNGTVNKRSTGCPGPGWVRGMFRKKKA